MPATPQYAWPMLAAELGAELWVKHENHTPAGAFKVRGGITFIDWLRENHPECRGIATATRGNHGQSQARAAAAAGLKATIVVPRGNAREKNDAMRSFGAKLIEHGKDFDESREEAKRLAALEDLYLVPPFHHALVSGVASYALELFSAVPDIKRVYVPIGCGSGICAVIAARDAMGLDTEVIGVVSTEATAAQQAFLSGKAETTASARTFADGVAVRSVVPEALAIYREGAQRVIAVSDDEIAHAMRLYFRCTHNVSEGAGAAPLAAAVQERDINAGQRIAVILCGGNVDTEVFQEVLCGRTPQV
ncbi:threonine dehydratase [Congregibacter sp.]|uniref:threonine dehydratase n=1 Tax=Congregibacter sp. TaxID=2744308 RepID=UPI00385EA309